MSRRSDAVVAELRRIERTRRVTTALALVVAFAATASIFVVHHRVARVAIAVAAGIIVMVLAATASRALNPFTMEKATRPRRTGVVSAKAVASEQKMDDLSEVEAAAAAITAEKRD